MYIDNEMDREKERMKLKESLHFVKFALVNKIESFPGHDRL